MMKASAGLLLISALWAASAAAAELITDRPDFADATIPVPPGFLQVESGYLFGKTSSADQHTLGQVLAKTGVSERLELRLGINSYETIDIPAGDDSGFSDGSLGFKLRLLEAADPAEAGAFNLAAIVFTGVPTGSDEFRGSHLTPGAMLTADLALSPHWTWAPFAQYAYAEDGVGQYSEFSAGFSFIRPLGATTGWYVEYYVTLAEEEFREDKNYLGTGFTQMVSDQVQLDLYGGTALNGNTPDYFIGGGLSFIVGLGG